MCEFSAGMVEFSKSHSILPRIGNAHVSLLSLAKNIRFTVGPVGGSVTVAAYSARLCKLLSMIRFLGPRLASHNGMALQFPLPQAPTASAALTLTNPLIMC